MNTTLVATAVTSYAGSMGEMLPHFLGVAIAVAVVVIALTIYSKMKK